LNSNLLRQKLPLPKHRKKSEGQVVGEAAQSFNIPNDEGSSYAGYIMGHLALPPKGIKDEEGSGTCVHTFTICHAQPNSVEVAFGDPEEDEFDPATAQRFLLGPGDQFRAPPGNNYKIRNHSATHDCLLTWVIIKPHDS